MLAYQIYISRLTGYLSLAAACQSSRIEQWTGGRCHAVPNLPGHVKGFTPYLLSRRRRQW